MARGGINKYLVQQARNALLVRDEYPSIDAVRVELGNTGSKSTIHRYLKELEEEEGAQLDDEALLSNTLKEMVSRMAARLHEEAKQVIERAASAHQKALEERDAAITALQAELESAKRSLSQMSDERDTEHATRLEHVQKATEATNQLAELRGIHEGLLARLAEKDERINSLEEKHRNARDALEHFRESAKAQRDDDQRAHVHQIQGLQGQVRELKDQVTGLQNDNIKLNGANAELVTQLGATQRELRERKSELQSAQDKLSVLSAQQAKTQSQAEQLKAALEEKVAEATQLASALETQQSALNHQERDRTVLEARLQVQEQLFSELKGQLAAALPGKRRSKTPDQTDSG